MNSLGSLFYNDNKDHVQAAEWFKKAAAKGCTRALNNLGICFELGQGVELDRDQAMQLYKESAVKGYVPGKFNLGYLEL